MMNQTKRDFDVYLTALRFLTYKVTENLRRIYMSMDGQKVTLTALYETKPSELELELFDDICTDTDAHLPEFLVVGNTYLFGNYDENQKHDFVLFSFYE